MKILLDECLPRRLARDLNRYSVTTVPRQGWAGTTDSTLLKLADGDFDVFITLDGNMAFQQNLNDSKLCIVVLRATSSRYETLQPLVPDMLKAIRHAKPGKLIMVGK